MEHFEKTEYLNQLFSFYGTLLTEKQQNYFINYYHLDLSLQEVALMYQVSRNAIHDQLNIVEKHLNDFEAKLNLYQLSMKRKELIELFLKTKDFKYIEDLRKLDE